MHSTTLALIWVFSSGVAGSITLISQTSQPWTVDLTIGGTKFKTCFDDTYYVPVASNIGGSYLRRQTEEFYPFLTRDPDQIYAIGCAGGRFDIFYSASVTLYGLGLSADSSGFITMTDFTAAPSFDTFAVADFNYPEDYTATYTFFQTGYGTCRFMNSLGDSLLVGMISTDICLPITSTGGSTAYLSAMIATDVKKNYTINNINKNGPSTVLPFQFNVSTDVTTKETLVFNNDYYLTSIDNNVFTMMHINDAGSDIETVTGVTSSSSMIFKSDVVPQYNGTIISGMVLQGGNLHIMIKLMSQTIVSTPYTNIIGLTETSLIHLLQLNETFFRVNLINGTDLISIDFLLGIDSTPVAPIEPSPAPSTSPVPNKTIESIIVSVNDSVTLDDLVLNQTTVLVIQNEAVVTVINCASLAGTLKYILSQSQYEKLIANNTLDVLVLLTQCTNGSFDAIQVTSETQDDCVALDAQSNRDPAQLTLLITAKKITGCGGEVINEPLLSVGAIIGIVIGCAAAVTLIIVLALYFSPVSAKVFPYAQRNRMAVN